MAKPPIDKVQTAQGAVQATAEILAAAQALELKVRRGSGVFLIARAQNDNVFPDSSKFVLSAEEAGLMQQQCERNLSRSEEVIARANKRLKQLTLDISYLVADVPAPVEDE